MCNWRTRITVREHIVVEWSFAWAEVRVFIPYLFLLILGGIAKTIRRL
jgi:hypothetical protein